MKKKKGKEGNNERWLLTYSDLITLLMIFFVVMYASSNVDVSKYKLMAQSLNAAMGGGGSNILQVGVDANSTDNKKFPASDKNKNDNNTNNNKGSTGKDGTGEKSETQQMEDIKKELDKYMQQNGLSGSVTSSVTERGLIVSLKDAAFFDSGQASVRPDYQGKIIEIAKIINQMGNYIRVEGHTDNIPISTSQFRSNWELSVIRATTVTELIISAANVSPYKISAIGYGEYRPIAENTTEAGRAKNRRIDIVVLSSKYNGEESTGKSQ